MVSASRGDRYRVTGIENAVLLFRVSGKEGQMKIMQMSFMIIGVFFFFVLVGLFFLTIMFKDVRGGAEELARAQAISSIEIVAGMPELNYDARDSMTIDEDKLRVMSSRDDSGDPSGGFGVVYEEFWPVASLEIYKVYPMFDSIVECPASDCNYYNIYDSGQRDVEKFSSYVSICKRVREFGSVYDRCEIGKIVVGVKKYEE